MGKCSCSVRTRSRIVAKPYQFLYVRPFPDDWKSPEASRKADAVSANFFEVLIAIKQTPVLSICRASISLSLSLSLTHSLTHSLFLFLTKKTCLPKRPGPRQTRLKLSLCVIGNPSVLLPLLQLLNDLESDESSYIAVTEVDKDFDHFQIHHEQQLTTATSTSARNFFLPKGVVAKAKSKARMRYHGYWGT